MTLLLLAILYISCAKYETWKNPFKSSASHISSQTPTSMSTPSLSITPTIPQVNLRKNHTSNTPTLEPTSTPNILGTSYDSTLDLRAGPVNLPLRIQIPILKVDAPILGVGLTEDNAMDAPKGEYDDPNWSSAFWYRGSAIPGESGTATIAGHVNGLLGQPETFARIRRLKPGDEIIITVNNSSILLTFIVDEVHVYSIEESSDPVILARIYGIGASNNDLQPALDGLSHLTLITCAGKYINGEFDHRTVVFATLRL